MAEPGELQSTLSFGTLTERHRDPRGDDKKLVAELGPFFQSVDRLIAMMRVHPVGHPLLDELGIPLLERLRPLLDQGVVVNLHDQKLTTLRGTTVYSPKLAEKNAFIWSTAHADGVMQLEFVKGLELDELLSFLEVIEQTTRADRSPDDDTVTLLWERNLQSIRYFATDGSAGDESNEFARLVAQAALYPGGDDARRLIERLPRRSLGHIDRLTTTQITTSAKTEPPVLKDADLAYAFAVDEALIDKLRSNWTSGTGLESRLVEALLAVVHHAPKSDARRATEALGRIVTRLIDDGQISTAAELLELLRGLSDGEAEDPLEEIVASLSEPLRIAALMNLFQRGDQNDAMLSLFTKLGRAPMTRQVLSLLADPQRKITSVRELTDLLFDLYDETVAELYAAPELTGKSIYLRRLLTELPNYEYRTWKPAAALIRRATENNDTEVRELALSLDHPCWADEQLARNTLVPRCSDPEAHIRALALDLLRARHPELYGAHVRESVMARAFGPRSLEEIDQLMRVHVEHGGADDLLPLLEIWGWFGKDAIAFAMLAADVLVDWGDEGARALLEARANHFFTAPALKKAYRASLERTPAEPTAEPAPSRPEPDPDELAGRSEAFANAALVSASVDEFIHSPGFGEISDPFADLPDAPDPFADLSEPSDPFGDLPSKPDLKPSPAPPPAEDSNDFDFDWDE